MEDKLISLASGLSTTFRSGVRVVGFFIFKGLGKLGVEELKVYSWWYTRPTELGRLAGSST